MSEPLNAEAPTDATLVARIGQGDPDAETEFCRRMGPRIRLYGLRHLRDGAAADDLVQQVLITTLEALRQRKLREADKLASFVLGTCRMTVLDLRRGTHRRAQLLEQFGRDLMPATTEQVVSPWETDQLARCVQALGERERTVVVMSFYDEKTSGNLAELLGVTEGNVRVIRHRALRQLRSCMEAAA